MKKLRTLPSGQWMTRNSRMPAVEFSITSTSRGKPFQFHCQQWWHQFVERAVTNTLNGHGHGQSFYLVIGLELLFKNPSKASTCLVGKKWSARWSQGYAVTLLVTLQGSRFWCGPGASRNHNPVFYSRGRRTWSVQTCSPSTGCPACVWMGWWGKQYYISQATCFQYELWFKFWFFPNNDHNIGMAPWDICFEPVSTWPRRPITFNLYITGALPACRYLVRFGIYLLGFVGNPVVSQKCGGYPIFYSRCPATGCPCRNVQANLHDKNVDDSHTFRALRSQWGNAPNNSAGTVGWLQPPNSTWCWGQWILRGIFLPIIGLIPIFKSKSS